MTTKRERIFIGVLVIDFIYLIIGLIILTVLTKPNEPIDRLYYEFWRLYSPNTASMNNLFGLIVLIPFLVIVALSFILMGKESNGV